MRKHVLRNKRLHKFVFNISQCSGFQGCHEQGFHSLSLTPSVVSWKNVGESEKGNLFGAGSLQAVTAYLLRKLRTFAPKSSHAQIFLR